MPGLRLSHQEGVPLPGQRAEVVGLRPGDVNRALPRERLVIEVENLVVETLQCAFGYSDEPYRQVQAGQPRRGLDQVREMLEIRLDLTAMADAAHRRYQAEGLIGLDHDSSLRPLGLRPRRPRRPGGPVLSFVLPDVSAFVCDVAAAPG